MDDLDDLLSDDAFACGPGAGLPRQRAGSQRRKISTPETKSRDDVAELLRELDCGDEPAGGGRHCGAFGRRASESKSAQSDTGAGFDDDGLDGFSDFDADDEKDRGGSGSRGAGASQGGFGARVAVLGGEKARVGERASLAMKIASKSLRCLNCDFEVERWPGMAWTADADYMHFRNAAPDRRKMAAKLEARRGAAAYACQCSWVSATETRAIRLGENVDGKTLKWV